MKALNYDERKYLNLILKGNSNNNEINFINNFNYNFIAKYIYGVAFEIGNTFKDLIECNIGYKTDTNKVKEKNIIELFFCELPESLHNVDKNFSLNILEVINRHISSRGDDFYYYIRNCIYYALDDVASMYYFPINIIDDQKYINIINYCLFYSVSNHDENKIIEYGELLLNELLYSYLFNDKSEMSLIDNEKDKLKQSLEIAINRYKEFTYKRFIKAFNINFSNSRSKNFFSNRVIETKKIIESGLDLINEDSNSEKLELQNSSNKDLKQTVQKEDKFDYSKMVETFETYISGGTKPIYKSVIEDKILPKDAQKLRMIKPNKADIVRFADCFGISISQINKIFEENIRQNHRPKEYLNDFFRVLKEINPEFNSKKNKG